MNDTLTTLDEQIRAFASAVRAELSDLPAEEVDDLVDGLVGDLTDQAADSKDDFQLGDHVEYARELRAAAGLPERTLTVKRMPVHKRLMASFTGLGATVRRSPFGRWLIDFFVSLRPVWWLLRGFSLYAIIGSILNAGPRTLTGQHSFGTFLLAWALLLSLVVISVQWGRDRWVPKNWLRHIRTIASLAVVVGLPMGWAAATTPTYIYEDTTRLEGLLLDGSQIGNLFVYDSKGELIEGAQIFTDRGTPLNLFGSSSDDWVDGAYWGVTHENGVAVPYIDPQKRPIWNIYPLEFAPFDYDSGEVEHDKAKPAEPPFEMAPSRVLPTPTPTPVVTEKAQDGPELPEAPTP